MGEPAASAGSGRHSLAATVFAALLGCRPLEGGSLRGERPSGEGRAWETYGHGARSVLGGHGAQDPGRVQGPAARTWPRPPGHMRALFHSALSQGALDGPGARPSELGWINGPARLRSEALVCSCGDEAPLDGSARMCRACERPVAPELYTELPAGEGDTIPVRGAGESESGPEARGNIRLDLMICLDLMMPTR